jgi:hypothetical protein
MIEKQLDVRTAIGDQVLVAELRTIPLAVTKGAHDWLVEFEGSSKIAPPERKREIRRIVEWVAEEYGRLDVPDLMARTYAEHPEMTTRSEIREEMARRMRTHRP